MIRAGFTALALVALSVPALAEDPRLVERLYDPSQVVKIEGRTGVQATIAFAEDEHIENVAIGDSQSWQVTPNKRANLLFVKPLSPTAATNMTVVTDRHTYLFDLVASPRTKPLYVLRFTYPEEPEAKRSHLAGAELGAPNTAEMAAANNPYAIVDPAALNFAWRPSGNRKILPAQVYDDGDSTFLIWPEGQPLPAILVKDHAGTEGPVNFAARDETIVVDGVPREIVLRSGKDSATLTNTGPARPAARQAAFARSTTASNGEVR